MLLDKFIVPQFVAVSFSSMVANSVEWVPLIKASVTHARRDMAGSGGGHLPEKGSVWCSMA